MRRTSQRSHTLPKAQRESNVTDVVQFIMRFAYSITYRMFAAYERSHYIDTSSKANDVDHSMWTQKQKSLLCDVSGRGSTHKFASDNA